MINAYDLINRLSRERTIHAKSLKTEFVQGILTGLTLAISIVRDMIVERQEFARIGRRLKA
jgi:hypothetical protein